MLAALTTLSGSTGEALRFTKTALLQATVLGQTPDQAVHAATMMLMTLAFPALAVALLAAAASTAAQVGFRLNFGLVAPKLERLDPSAAWKRIFGTQGLIEVLRSLVAVGISDRSLRCRARRRLPHQIARMTTTTRMAMTANDAVVSRPLPDIKPAAVSVPFILSSCAIRPASIAGFA